MIEELDDGNPVRSHRTKPVLVADGQAIGAMVDRSVKFAKKRKREFRTSACGVAGAHADSRRTKPLAMEEAFHEVVQSPAMEIYG
jgi:hypothetical protein